MMLAGLLGATCGGDSPRKSPQGSGSQQGDAGGPEEPDSSDPVEVPPDQGDGDNPGAGGGSGSSKQTVQYTNGSPDVAPDAPGLIRGNVFYDGEVPTRRNIQISGGGCPNHGETVPSESLIVTDGKVRFAFVYVDRGLGDEDHPVPEDPVTLDQEGCMYSPHVVSVRVGQTLHVRNSDNTTHNVHSDAMNQTQPASSPARVVVYDKENIGHLYKCDIHPWMSGYVCAVEHPFHAVTGEDGSFTLPPLRPGKYRLAVWHERCGKQRIDVDLPPGGEADVRFNISIDSGGARRRRR